MEIRINNILDLQLANEDVTAFIDLFGTLRESLETQKKKVGFKKQGVITLELTDESIHFITKMCDAAGIVNEDEEELENQQD